MIIENFIKHVRLGKKNNFIYQVVLVDGTIIQNMQYENNANIPTNEQLRSIDAQNMLGGAIS